MEPYLAETLQRQVFSQSLKCSAQDLSADLLDMRDTQRIIDGLGLIRLFFWFPKRCFWASGVVHVVSLQ